MSDHEILVFEVVGSTGVVYDVTAKRDGASVTMFCTCDAAANGTACKHRLAILGGDAGAVRTGGELVATLFQLWLPGSALARAVADVKSAEIEAETVKRKLASTKKALARIMTQRV